jgi:Anti-sigma-K factor rskA
MSYPHDEAEDRVIARALDIDRTDEIDEAAMDRATLDEYREVLAYLFVEEQAPPAGLEDRVVDAALARRPAAARSIARPARRRSTARWITLGAAVAAAAAVITFMFATTGDDGGAPGGRVELAAAGNAQVVPVLQTPGVRKAPLETQDGAQVGDVGDAALAPDGNGVLYNLDLPTRPGYEPYVWLVTDTEVVPIGALTMPTESQAFDVTGDVGAVKGVAISSERSGTDPDLDTKPTFVATATV